MATFNQKLAISAGSALTVGLVSLPQIYKLTNSLLGLNLFNEGTNCPTMLGHVAHTLVFMLITFLTMGNVKEKTWIKVKHTLYGGLIMYFLTSPAVYALVGGVLGTADAAGCPSMMGILLHSVVYMLALVAVMYLPEKNK
jgi:hypothetical protein